MEKTAVNIMVMVIVMVMDGAEMCRRPAGC